MLRGEPLQRRRNEVATRCLNGETVGNLATEYGVTRYTIRLWRDAGTPHITSIVAARNDLNTWADTILGSYTTNLYAAEERGDWRTYTKLAEGIRQLLGIDHDQRREDARLHLEAAKLDLLTQALNQAAQRAGLSPETITQLGTHLDQAIAEAETHNTP